MTKILIVDDDEVVRFTLKRALSFDTMLITLTESAQKAISELERVSFDLLILDLVLPVMNGIELLKTLKSNHSHAKIPVIICTAFATPELEEKVLGIGADFLLAKPFEIEGMINVVQKTLS